jgi:hypothetical protein
LLADPLKLLWAPTSCGGLELPVTRSCSWHGELHLLLLAILLLRDPADGVAPAQTVMNLCN